MSGSLPLLRMSSLFVSHRCSRLTRTAASTKPVSRVGFIRCDKQFTPFFADNPNAASLYALDVKNKIDAIQKQGRNVSASLEIFAACLSSLQIAAFLCESLQSCGGQIVYPENYLKETYRFGLAFHPHFEFSN